MGRFLSDLGFSPGAAAKAHTLGISLDDVQALVGSMPQNVHDLVGRAERAGLIVTQANTNHYKIWQHAEGVGAPVGIPSTGSDSQHGLRNSVAEIRRRFGIDLRQYKEPGIRERRG